MQRHGKEAVIDSLIRRQIARARQSDIQLGRQAKQDNIDKHTEA